jgi:hypothetical protein
MSGKSKKRQRAAGPTQSPASTHQGGAARMDAALACMKIRLRKAKISDSEWKGKWPGAMKGLPKEYGVEPRALSRHWNASLLGGTVQPGRPSKEKLHSKPKLQSQPMLPLSAPASEHIPPPTPNRRRSSHKKAKTAGPRSLIEHPKSGIPAIPRPTLKK